MGAAVQVRISAPELLPELCDYLSKEGFVAVQAGRDTAHVLSPLAESEFEAARLLLEKLDLWRVTQRNVSVSVDPGI